MEPSPRRKIKNQDIMKHLNMFVVTDGERFHDKTENLDRILQHIIQKAMPDCTQEEKYVARFGLNCHGFRERP
jgi:hypothetical protein